MTGSSASHLFAFRHIWTLPKDDSLRLIADFLETGKERGAVPASADCRADAEYLLSGASGVMIYWITLTDGEISHQMEKILKALETRFDAKLRA